MKDDIIRLNLLFLYNFLCIYRFSYKFDKVRNMRCLTLIGLEQILRFSGFSLYTLFHFYFTVPLIYPLSFFLYSPFKPAKSSCFKGLHIIVNKSYPHGPSIFDQKMHKLRKILLDRNEISPFYLN